MIYDNKEYEIQLNFCTDPFCKWFGKPQEHFNGKLHRYRKSGSDTISIFCNENPNKKTPGFATSTSTMLLSNWSIAEEITRLANNNKVVNKDPVYKFHKADCTTIDATPFANVELFHKRGKSSSNSQKWQCKDCKKITNTLPSIRECFTYHQKRNDILPLFADLLLNRVPVKRTCEILGIGNSTYYNKLEILYQRCLEFLEKHEQEAFKKRNFDEMYLDTDYMMYYLNNVRRKGKGGERYDNLEDAKLETHIAATGDVFSRYILRADIAFDWNFSMETLWETTCGLKEDHLPYYSRVADRYKFSAYPQPPTPLDKQTQKEVENELIPIKRREQYVGGLHITSTYTAIAHLWLIREMVKSKKWWLNTDDDNTIKTALLRVFAEEIALGNAHCFITSIEETKSKPEAYREWIKYTKELLNWGQIYYGRKNVNLYTAARKFLEIKLKSHNFYEWSNVNGVIFKKKATTPINHPIPTIDEGIRSIHCFTDVSDLSNRDLATAMVNVNQQVLKSFFGQIHRRISIFERPLLTARRDRKSYIYANFNPKYGQYALTILRTYHNFCQPWSSSRNKGGSKEKAVLTPAQRLGLTNKVFEMKDIIYLK
ncbi:MAG: insertion element protein [Firmicutes bacterium]|nr:insertion element protein [Bacillota bacterium]MCL5994392.1 insertion element protein [Bacillota bacterium]